MEIEKAEFIAGFMAGITNGHDVLQIDVVGDCIQVSNHETGDVWKFSRRDMLESAAKVLSGLVGMVGNGQ